MKAFLVAASALALAASATAKMTGPGATPSAPTATPPAESATTPSLPMPAQESVGAAPVSAPTDPKAIIAAEFPTYDKNADNALSRAEFDAWMIALKERSGDTAMKPAEQSSWLKTAFSAADKNKNKGVTLAELTDYLTAAG